MRYIVKLISALYILHKTILFISALFCLYCHIVIM
nr:MAG TPA: hypothetical protein [Bacteriophage sp.]